MPPSTCSGPSASPRSATASATVTTGSTVETIDAVDAPTRSMPSTNVTIGRTVDSRAIATIQIQPSPNASAPPAVPATRNVAAASVATSEVSEASMCSSAVKKKPACAL
jgi:hypothetical protein